MNEVYKLKRLYVETLPQGLYTLDKGQSHYLKNVLRLNPGDPIRVFHPQAGEFLARFDGRGFTPGERLRAPHQPGRRVHLYAPPLVKDRFDFLIEKGCELGMTDFHPLLTARGQIRTVNADRLHAQAIEAAEQCERLDIPVIHKPAGVKEAVAAALGTVYAAVERMDNAPVFVPATGDVSILIGPPGGWDDAERALLLDKAVPLDLGVNVLRAETAALVTLVRLVG